MNLLELFVKVGVDAKDVDEGFDKIKKQGGSLQSFFSGLGKVTIGFGTTAAAAVGSAATAIGTISKKALEAYANVEQLEGGAQLMFGSAYDYVAKRAALAYKNVQMSSAAYLEQANAFATGLKTSLGGDEQAAAELADRIITAQADIVAATGASQEMVSNAFVGLMRNNYTMLDNLQIGITPTKEGFQQLIAQVNKANAAQGNYTKYQMENLADMQSALIDYIEMQGLSGYAAMEAADTISGATASMRSAWEDWIAALGDPSKDFGKTSQNLVDSIVKVANQIGPRLIATLPRITGAFSSLFSELAPQAVTMIGETAPEFANGISEMLQTLSDNLPELTDVAESLVTELGGAVLEALPTLGNAAGELVLGLGSFISGNANNILFAATDLLFGLVDGMIEGIPELGTMISNLLDNLFGEGGFLSPDNITDVATKGAEMFVHLLDNTTDMITELVKKIPEIIKGLIDGFTQGDNLDKLIDGGISIVSAFFSDGIKLAAALLDSAGQIIQDLLTGLSDPQYLKKLQNGGSKMVEELTSGDWDNILFSAAGRIIQGIITGLFNFGGNITAAITGYDSKEDFEQGTAQNLRSALGLSTGAEAQKEWEDYWGLNSKLGSQKQYVGGMELNPYASAGMNGSTVNIYQSYDSTATPSEIKARSRAAIDGALAQ